MILLGKRKYQALLDEIAALRSSLAVMKHGFGRARQPAPVRFTIVSVADDWVVCTYADAAEEATALGEAEPAGVLVAKHAHMRKTGNTTDYTYGAITDDVDQIRTHTASGDEQEVFPPYVVGGELEAGMVMGGVPDLLDDNDETLMWIEITPRHWAKDCS